MKKAVFIALFMFVLIRVNAQVIPQMDPERKTVNVYATAKDTDLRLASTGTLAFSPFGQPLESQPSIFVDPSKTFQTFMGIGAALTDAAAETFYKLPAEKQQQLLKAYYDREAGIGYTLARTTIHSCDFSSASYTYVDEGDRELETFSISPDLRYKIPFIKRAMEAAGGDLPIFASPWSPPAWMKDNRNMLRGGKLLPEFNAAWANYFVRFIQEYDKQGIPIWGITVQNEPMAVQTWESCIFTAEEERDFIRDFLGPTLWDNGMKDIRLIAWDHNRDLVYHRASTILSDDEAASYVWGIGFHWYESWSGEQIPENLQLVSEAFPGKPIMLTEACNFPFSWETFDRWYWGENYGESMISDFNHGAVAWTDWNILLDETGGPNHVGNFCFAPVHADTRDGTLHYMNSYYYIGHFSKFIRPGARRIACSSSRAQLKTTGFINPDGSIAVIVMNPGDSSVNYRLYVHDQAVETTSLPHSIMTVVF